MARNAEKAMTTLARWRASQLGSISFDKDRRPYLASTCRSLYRCEKWRMQVIREIAMKVSQIQNAGLGEFRLRDLNDEINKLLREKGHWEDQIKELGGPDFSKVGPKMLDHEGKEVPGNRGYKYFGAAKDLPGVRELFEQEPPPPPRKTRAELMKDIDADYYGYRDDDDGILQPLEKEAEAKSIAEALKMWQRRKDDRLENNQEEEIAEEEEDIYGGDKKGKDALDDIPLGNGEARHSVFSPDDVVPTQRDIEAALLQHKKEELLKKYASAQLQESINDPELKPS